MSNHPFRTKRESHRTETAKEAMGGVDMCAICGDLGAVVLGMCKKHQKESQETKHWLRMLSSYHPNKIKELREYWQEAQEFSMIFHKIVNTMKIKNSLKIK